MMRHGLIRNSIAAFRTRTVSNNLRPLIGIRYQSSTSSSSDDNDASLPSHPTIGFIGLGNMGLPMCLNLLKAFPQSTLHAYDVNPKSMDAAVSSGAQPLSSPKDLFTSSDDDTTKQQQQQYPDVIFTMLPGCDAVQNVYSDILSSISTVDSSRKQEQDKTKTKNVVFVDCSTISPLTSRSLHSLIDVTTTSSSSLFSLSMIDAPVSGGVAGATNATLTFMVGGDTHTFQKTLPFLDAMGKNAIHCGGPSAGSAVKICNNLALAGQMIAVAEAMNLGDALGVDVTTLKDVMTRSTAGCWSCEVNNPHPDVGAVAKGGYEGGFGTRLMLKDLGLAVGAAEDKGVSTPMGVMSREMYRLVERRGWGGKDFGVVSELLRGK